ncbi:MAG: hypothetical protein QXO22_01080 [Thermosphaera sp.]
MIVIILLYNIPPIQVGDYSITISISPSDYVIRFKIANITVFTSPSNDSLSIKLIIRGLLNATIANIPLIYGQFFYDLNLVYEASVANFSFSPNIDVMLDLGIPGYHPAIPTYAYHTREGYWELRFQSPGYLDAYAELYLLQKDPSISVQNNGDLTGLLIITAKSDNHTIVKSAQVSPREEIRLFLEGYYLGTDMNARLCYFRAVVCFNYSENRLFFALRDNLLLLLTPLLLAEVIHLLRTCKSEGRGSVKRTKKI